MALEYFDAAGTATSDGVFIPITDLPGLLSTELAAAEPAAKKMARSIYAVMKQLFTILNPTSFNKLGVTISRAEASGGFGLSNKTYTLGVQYLANISADTVGMLPIPTIGANSGVGDFAVIDLFPNAAKVAAAGAVAGAGILIQTADLVGYGSPSHASLNIASGQDNRSWLAALMNWLTSTISVRSTTVSSAFTAVSRGTPANATLPANATDTTNPTTGLLTSDLTKTFSSSISYSITIQLIDDEATDSFDVNVATA